MQQGAGGGSQISIREIDCGLQLIVSVAVVVVVVVVVVILGSLSSLLFYTSISKYKIYAETRLQRYKFAMYLFKNHQKFSHFLGLLSAYIY